jgi:hypothetical protein
MLATKMRERTQAVDQVTFIVTALAAGAAEAVKDGAQEAVVEAYHRLRDRVKALFAGNHAAQVALDEHEKAPADWERPLAAKLTESGAGDDAELRSAAESLLALLDRAPSSGSKYNISIRDSHVFSVGDHNHQVINVGDGTAGRGPGQES